MKQDISSVNCGQVGSEPYCCTFNISSKTTSRCITQQYYFFFTKTECICLSLSFELVVRMIIMSTQDCLDGNV